MEIIFFYFSNCIPTFTIRILTKNFIVAMTKGYLKNRFKRADDRTDVQVSWKHNAEANIGELFYSREANKLAFKKDIGSFVYYDAPQIITGPVGPTGPQGVAGPVGPAGLEWQGAWVSGATYAVDDAVGYDGASWFCISATSGTTAPDLDPTHWALLAAEGAQGPQGPQGIPGAANAPQIIGLHAEDGLIVTGTLAATKSVSIRIPANTLGERELLEMVWSTLRFAGNGGVIQSSVYVNTADTLVGATKLATGGNVSAFQYNVKGVRDVQIINSSALLPDPNSIGASDFSPAGSVVNITWDVTVDQYILFATTNFSAADKSLINKVRVIRYNV